MMKWSRKRTILTGVLLWISLNTVNYFVQPDNATVRELLKKNRYSCLLSRASMNCSNSYLDDGNQVINSLDGCQTSICADDIIVYNRYWQKLEVSDGSIFYIYNAYLDNRTTVTNTQLIRILAMRNHVTEQTSSYFCRIQFDNDVNYTTKDVRIEPIGSKITYWQAILITCEINQEYRYNIPKSVSLLEDPLITVNNKMEVYINKHTEREREIERETEKKEKRDLAICHKALEFPDYDNSIYLIEWFELMLLQGVDQIFMYEYSVHPNISKVLDYYIKKGKLQVTPLTMPPNMIPDISHKTEFITTNTPVKSELEQIPVNDCFYKNMNKFKFIAVIDQDEVIVPKIAYKLSDMIKALKIKSQTIHPKEHFPAYSFNRYNSVFENQKPNEWNSDIPKHMSLLLRSSYRSPVAMPFYDGEKSVLDTELVVATSNHRPSICVSECENKIIQTLIGHTRHFRSTCKSNMKYYYKYCNEKSIEDDSMHKYKSELVKNVAKALDECLGIREL